MSSAHTEEKGNLVYDAANSFHNCSTVASAQNCCGPEHKDNHGDRDGCCPARNGSGGYSLPVNKDNHGVSNGDDEVEVGGCPARNGSGGYGLPVNKDSHGVCNGDDEVGHGCCPVRNGGYSLLEHKDNHGTCNGDDDVGDGRCPVRNGCGGYSLLEHKDNHGTCNRDDEVEDVASSSAQNGSFGYNLPDNYGACNGDDDEVTRRRRKRSKFWVSCSGVRVNFQGHKFTIPGRVKFIQGYDENLLQFESCGGTDVSSLLEKLTSKYSSPLSKFYNPSLQFDVVDETLYVTMPSSPYSDLIGPLVDSQLGLYQKRVKKLMPNRPYLLLSGSSSLFQFNGVPERLCGDGAIISEQELFVKCSQAHRQRRSVPQNMHVYVNFEALSFTDSKRKLFTKCTNQVEKGMTQMAVALCDKRGDGEVALFYEENGRVVMESLKNPRFINLHRVLPSFRVYLSYGASMYFPVLHSLPLKELPPEELLHNLCDAIISGDDEMAKELVNGLGSVNFCDPTGRLPLVCAVQRRNITMVHYLLENGADVQVIDIDGVSPTLVGMALSLNNITNTLQQKGGTVDLSWKAIEDSIEKSQLTKLDYLFKAGASMNQRNANGKTILMHACEIHKRDLVAHLLRGGVVIDDTDEKGRSALMQASFAGNIQELEQLLVAKASVDLRDSKGQTALMLACHAEHADIVARLLIAGADKSLRDNVGRTAKEFATFSGNSSILNMLG